MPFYYLCLANAVVAYVAVLYGARSTFGLTLQAIRDNPRRMRAIGFNVTAHKVFAWWLAGLIAGAAGILLVWFNGRISPGTIAVGPSINILVIAIIGGLRHPIGPFIGAVVVTLMQTFAIDIIGAERFNTLIGLVFLLIVFISPDGILGLWERFKPQAGRDDWRSFKRPRTKLKRKGGMHEYQQTYNAGPRAGDRSDRADAFRGPGRRHQDRGARHVRRRLHRSR
ncbi:branched-chain amino acid ABC transporter permease [uncultured Roseibium sp.]|uniref:branched-chain amino acid ABC transporter permease n=1 Tax=uncultured Roseibium sp. TaxID=1936171 RepID=UPI003217AAE5